MGAEQHDAQQQCGQHAEQVQAERFFIRFEDGRLFFSQEGQREQKQRKTQQLGQQREAQREGQQRGQPHLRKEREADGRGGAGQCVLAGEEQRGIAVSCEQIQREMEKR